MQWIASVNKKVDKLVPRLRRDVERPQDTRTRLENPNALTIIKLPAPRVKEPTRQNGPAAGEFLHRNSRFRPPSQNWEMRVPQSSFKAGPQSHRRRTYLETVGKRAKEREAMMIPAGAFQWHSWRGRSRSTLS